MPVFVITGPSGVGKGTLIRALRERVPELELSVSATTRAAAAGGGATASTTTSSPTTSSSAASTHGDFVEHARYSGRRYGTLRSELERRGAGGRPVVLEIEVQGARQVREAMPEAVQIFIAPPSEEALRARLVGRGTDSPEQVAARLDDRARGARRPATSSRTSSSTTASRTPWPSSRRWFAGGSRADARIVAPYGGPDLDLSPRRQAARATSTPTTRA